jgi:tetratricopeptide (TPR) repeat protein
MRPVIRFAVAIPVVLLASYGIRVTLRLALAERCSHADTVTALQAALEMTPGNADHHARIATLDSSADAELRAALSLNPRDPSWWIMQSVRQEEEGDLAAAEKSLQRANTVSNYYTPRWSLAAFYYRQGKKAEFIRWARSALSVGHGQPESLFQMAQRLDVPSEQILSDIVPQVPERVESYLRFLLQQGKVDQQHAAAVQLIRIGSKDNRNPVLETCEHLFIAGRIDQALDLWNRAVQLRWIALFPLDPASGRSLGNGSFIGESLEVGFDWKHSIPFGVSASRAVPERSLQLEFSGSQPETCELISQFVPLLPNRRYRFTVRYRLRSTASATGLQWSILPASSDRPFITGLMNPSPDEFAEQAFPFETPPRQLPARILLSYARPTGVTRMEGQLWIQSVELTLLR